MSEENKALMHRWFEEVWNNGRVSAIDELFAEDGLAYGLADEQGGAIRGPLEFKTFHAKFRGAFPDINVSVEDILAEGDKLAARISVRGTHVGNDLGVAASQATVDFTGMVMVRIKDGKIVEAWNNIHVLTMNQQIGIK